MQTARTATTATVPATGLHGSRVLASQGAAGQARGGDHIDVGYSPSITSTTTWAPTPLSRVLGELSAATRDGIERLRVARAEQNRATGDGRPEDAKRYGSEVAELKAGLPAFTPSGTYRGARRKDERSGHTGLLSFDIDGKDHGNLNARTAPVLRDALAKLPYVAYAAVSASGAGVWGLIPVTLPTGGSEAEMAAAEELHGRYFDHVAGEWASQFGVQLDAACNDVSRARYLAYDGDARGNSAARALTEGDIPPPTPEVIPTGYKRRPRPKARSGDDRPPWEHYDAERTPVDELEDRGWTVASRGRGKVYLKRPGNTEARQSGNYDVSRGVFVAHTASTPLPDRQGLTASAIRAYYDHGGDFAEMARELRAQGWGGGGGSAHGTGQAPRIAKRPTNSSPAPSAPVVAPKRLPAPDSEEPSPEEPHPSLEVCPPEDVDVSPCASADESRELLPATASTPSELPPTPAPSETSARPPLPNYMARLITELREMGKHDRADHYERVCARGWGPPTDSALRRALTDTDAGHDGHGDRRTGVGGGFDLRGKSPLNRAQTFSYTLSGNQIVSLRTPRHDFASMYEKALARYG